MLVVESVGMMPSPPSMAAAAPKRRRAGSNALEHQPQRPRAACPHQRSQRQWLVTEVVVMAATSVIIIIILLARNLNDRCGSSEGVGSSLYSRGWQRRPPLNKSSA